MEYSTSKTVHDVIEVHNAIMFSVYFRLGSYLCYLTNRLRGQISWIAMVTSLRFFPSQTHRSSRRYAWGLSQEWHHRGWWSPLHGVGQRGGTPLPQELGWWMSCHTELQGERELEGWITRREVRSGRELSGGRRGSKREGIGLGEWGKTLQLYATLATEVCSIVKYILQETLSKRSFYHLTEWFFCPGTYFPLLSGPTESFYEAGLHTGASWEVTTSRDLTTQDYLHTCMLPHTYSSIIVHGENCTSLIKHTHSSCHSQSLWIFLHPNLPASPTLLRYFW